MPPNNILPIHGNEKTMNLNSLLLTNIQASPYFKVQLYELKTYHQVIDEIYTRVNHLEPWEKGSRKTAGQTGMCGGVRGVGAGGIVSSSFCLLYKLFTLKLTRKQLIGLCTHTDSPYIRGIGLMYARFTLPPGDLWDWFESYLDDEEEVDVKAGGGHIMTIGEVANHFLTKLEWYSTLFPRIPVPIQKQIEHNLLAKKADRHRAAAAAAAASDQPSARGDSARPQEERSPVRERRSSPVYERRRSPVYSRYNNSDRSQSRGYSDIPRRPSDRERERHRSRSTERHDSRHKSSSRRSSVDRDHDRHSHSRHDRHHSSSSRQSADRRHDDRYSRSDREKPRHGEHRRHRSRSQEHRHSHSGSRHGSHSCRSPRRDRSPERNRCPSGSPRRDDPYQQDLQKELDRVRQSKSSDSQNGGCDRND